MVPRFRPHTPQKKPQTPKNTTRQTKSPNSQTKGSPLPRLTSKIQPVPNRNLYSQCKKSQFKLEEIRMVHIDQNGLDATVVTASSIFKFRKIFISFKSYQNQFILTKNPYQAHDKFESIPRSTHLLSLSGYSSCLLPFRTQSPSPPPLERSVTISVTSKLFSYR